MNKKLKHIIFASLLIILFGGCELDTKDDFWHTEETLKTTYGYLFGFAHRPYTYIPNGFKAIDNNLFAAVTDEAQYVTNTSQTQRFNEGSWNKYNNPDDRFSTFYRGIHDVYYALENTTNYVEALLTGRDTTTSNGKDNYLRDIENMNWLLKEIKAVEAYYYFELFKRYGGVPVIEGTFDDNPDGANIPRADVDEIVHHIVKLIDDVKDELVIDWSDTGFITRKGRVTKGVALAIKSSALLYAASPLFNPEGDVSKWEAAAAAASEIIEMNKYSLDPSYRNLFKTSYTINSPEVIWSLRMGETNELERENYPIGTPGGATGIAPSHNLVEAYEHKGEVTSNPYENLDPRFYATILKNGDSWNGRTLEIFDEGADDPARENTSPTGYYLKKFLNENLNLIDNKFEIRSWIIFRYGEVLLNYAEAMNEAYGPDDNHGYLMTAREALNMVRGRPGVEMPPVNNGETKNEMREIIKHERRIELAFEGHRYWDLKRWGDAENVLNQPVKGVKVTKDGENFTYAVVNIANRKFDASKMYLYPISESDIVRSDGVLEQNPNW